MPGNTRIIVCKGKAGGLPTRAWGIAPFHRKEDRLCPSALYAIILPVLFLLIKGPGDGILHDLGDALTQVADGDLTGCDDGHENASL